MSISIASGLIGSAGINFDLLINYRSGIVSIASGVGMQFGVGNGAGITATTGFAWNLNGNNQNYANINTVGSAQIAIPGTFLGAAFSGGSKQPFFW